ncbi:MAG: hypothetical protein IPJ95_07625 [Gemmatimonadetes bacterium]|nr:hypothetical protein [Gemmatimonadota bacterium]MBK9692445.1 hypothetical protein [Gemmatimonadota bacterium]
MDVRVSTIPTLHGESVVLRLLREEGRRGSLREDGLRQVRAGVTTVEEVLRVTQG